MTRFHIPRLTLVAALGALAILALPAVAAAKPVDRNHDGIPDRWEKRHHLSLKVNQAHRNQDHEGLNNLAEFENGTNPRAADTDEDGLTDSQEVEVGDDPTNPDSNNNGIDDGEEGAGTVESFGGSMLTIKLFGGGTLSGQVTESTEISCEESHDGGAQASEDNETEEENQAESEGSDSGDSNENATCTSADLVPGATIQEAHLADEGSIFEEVKLVR